MKFAYPVRLHNRPEVGVNAHLCGPGGNPQIGDFCVNATVTHTLLRALTHTIAWLRAHKPAPPLVQTMEVCV